MKMQKPMMGDHEKMGEKTAMPKMPMPKMVQNMAKKGPAMPRKKR